MHIYKVTWYNEDGYGMTDYTSITFFSEGLTPLNRKERIESAIDWLQYKGAEVDVGQYEKVSAVEIKDPVIAMTVHAGLLG